MLWNLCQDTKKSPSYRSSVHNKTLVDALVKTIDPDSKYIDNDTSVSRLMNCTANFPEVTVSDSYGPVRSTDGSITNIVALARNTNVQELTPIFEESILPLLDPDKITYALSALQSVITLDVSLRIRRSVFKPEFSEW